MTLRFFTAGESHGPALIAMIDGLPAGLDLPVEVINSELKRRQKGFGSGERQKIESDKAIILSGVMGGKTIGSPLTIMIENLDHVKWKDKAIAPFTVPRPGHADLTGAIKYGFSDLRLALERASARETAARVAIGGVCKHLLAQFGIQIGGYVVSIGTVAVEIAEDVYEKRFKMAEASDVRCPSIEGSADIQHEIEKAIQAKDTLGGVIEIVALGVPSGLGGYAQWDHRLEARLGAALLSVQAIKGVEFGDGFRLAAMYGTLAQDGIYLKGDALIRKTNHAGGLEGGITNGEPLVMRVAMKPIATTLTPQSSVDLVNQIEVETKYERSDICPIPRAVVVLESMVAFILADALLEKLGGDSIAEIMPRFSSLRNAKLSDLSMENVMRTFWNEGD